VLLPRFPPLQSGAAFSSPAFSTPAFSFAPGRGDFRSGKRNRKYKSAGAEKTAFDIRRCPKISSHTSAPLFVSVALYCHVYFPFRSVWSKFWAQLVLQVFNQLYFLSCVNSLLSVFILSFLFHTFLRQGGYVLWGICLFFICSFVCLLTTLRKNEWSHLHKNFTRIVSLDKKSSH